MSLNSHIRIPLMELAILGAMIICGWAAFRLAKAEQEISGYGKESREFQAVFTRCQELFRPGLSQQETTRQESEFEWEEARRLKAEYRGIAERLEWHLARFEKTLQRSVAGQIRPELLLGMRDLKHWVDGQIDRAVKERFEVRSQELQQRINRTARLGTTGALAVTHDLGSLLKQISEISESFLSDFSEVINTVAQPLGGDHASRLLNRVRKTMVQLHELARQSRLDGKAIESALKTLSPPETASRTHRDESVIQAFLEVRSPEEFTRRVYEILAIGGDSTAAFVGNVESFRQARRGLWVVVAGLGVILIVGLYRRVVSPPPRPKLTESTTIVEHRKKLAHFEELAAGLAHEIRNPLTIMSARLYTVQRKLQKETPEHRDVVIIGREIDRVSQILKDFTQLTRPAAPKLTLLTAEPLLKEACELMAPQVQQHSARLECNIQTQRQFKADPQQIKQVLINLIQNAIESMHQSVRIILHAHDGHQPLGGVTTQVVVLEVEDNGPGISPEVQSRLFDPFFSTKSNGTGLGLSISARIVDRHGGTLDFTSEIGRGTVFRIILPAYEAG